MRPKTPFYGHKKLRFSQINKQILISPNLSRAYWFRNPFLQCQETLFYGFRKLRFYQVLKCVILVDKPCYISFESLGLYSIAQINLWSTPGLFIVQKNRQLHFKNSFARIVFKS